MPSPKKSQKNTNLSITISNDAINFQFNAKLTAIKSWWFFVMMAAVLLVWRPELTDYIKAVVLLIQP